MSQRLPRWILQSAAGILLALSLNVAFGAAAASPRQNADASKGISGDGCLPGFSGSAETGCADVNECAVNNGGCHRLAMCLNTPGARTCGGCPEDYAGDGYVGCFDVNECPNGDCSDRIPVGAENAPPPVVTASGDVTLPATSAKGAAATFTATAKDSVDGSRPVSCTPASGSVFRIGKTTVTCWASNHRGKIGQATLTVTVQAAQ